MVDELMRGVSSVIGLNMFKRIYIQSTIAFNEIMRV